MPVPTVITDLSTTIASNSPEGTDAPASTDDFLRAHAAFIAQNYAYKLDRAGTVTATANQPMGGFKHTGAGTATAAGQYVVWGQTGAELSSPALTGTPTAPTAAVGTDTTQVATTAFVKAAVDASGATIWQTDETGESFLIGPDGTTLYPATWVIGGIEEGYVAGSPQSAIQVDSGSDTADHAQVLWIANCTLAGNPDTEDDALASERMVDYATDSEVYKSGVDGGTSGESFALRYPAGLTMLHFGLAGGGSYTVAAGNTLTGTQMVLMTFPEADGVVAVEIKLLTATLGTTGKRYRQIMVTPYSAG